MTLSQFERLTLINQFRILRTLEKTKDYDESIEVLERGYTFRYGDITKALLPEVSEDDCRFVVNVIDMYRALHFAQKKHGKVDHDFAEFAGFDGNNETSLMAFARFEIGRDGMWDELKPLAKMTDNFNSHTPLRDSYERMLLTYSGMKRDPATYLLAKEQVEQVLAAAR